MRKKMILFTTLLLCISFFAVGCSTEPNTGQKANLGNQASNSQPKKEVKPVTYKQGDSVEIDGLKMAITEAKAYESSNQFMKAKEGNMYFAIMVEVENISDKSNTYNPFNYKLNNKDGSNYKTAFTDIEPSLSSGTLQPTKKAKGYLVYEIPSGTPTNQLEFVYEPLSFDSKQVIWELN